jgi:hypothetical protein
MWGFFMFKKIWFLDMNEMLFGFGQTLYPSDHFSPSKNRLKKKNKKKIK